ncbi:MAG: replicative DNA helicase [Caulobacterales bacterium]
MADGEGPVQTPAPTKAAPHSIEAEQALLGAILYDNETYNRLGDKLKPEHFYDPVHALIYERCARLIRANKLADGVTLKEQFQKEGALAQIGGAQYLVTLIENAARLPTHAVEYGEMIYDLALRRALIRIGEEIAGLARDPREGDSGEVLLSTSEQKLFNLGAFGTENKGFAPFSRALTASIEMVTAAVKTKDDVSGLKTNFDDLDRMLGGLHKSDLIILAGRPSMGKTALATNIAFNIAHNRLKDRRDPKTLGPDDRRQGGVVAFYSLEMSAEQLASRLLADFASIESDRIRRGKLSKEEFERLKDASVTLASLPLHIDETGAIPISSLQARARRLQRTHGLDCIVVDYLQLVTAGERKSEGRVQEVSEITMGLKALAKDLKVPVIALSQLSRQVELREDKRPQLSDLRESGSIEQDADAVLFVYRESYYLERQEPQAGTQKHFEWQQQVEAVRNQAEVIIGKQRHGPIGKVRLHFDSRYTRFGNLAQTGRFNNDPDE